MFFIKSWDLLINDFFVFFTGCILCFPPAVDILLVTIATPFLAVETFPDNFSITRLTDKAVTLVIVLTVI